MLYEDEFYEKFSQDMACYLASNYVYIMLQSPYFDHIDKKHVQILFNVIFGFYQLIRKVFKFDSYYPETRDKLYECKEKYGLVFP